MRIRFNAEEKAAIAAGDIEIRNGRYWHPARVVGPTTELKALRDLADGYAADWAHGVTLIRDSYFRDYAQELAEEIGAINADAGWPNNCIDWGQAARELQMDYTPVSFDGIDYWIR